MNQEEQRQEPLPRRAGRKALEWAKRYGPSEVFGLAFAYLGSRITHDQTGSEVAAAYAATWAENFGYYGTMLAQQCRHDRREALAADLAYGMGGALKTARDLFGEFIVGEAADSFLVRPLTMAFGTEYAGRGLGVCLGSWSANAVFYGLTIPSYELIQKVKRRRARAAAKETQSPGAGTE